MKLKIRAFPAVYMNTACSRHLCKVVGRVDVVKNFGDEEVVGAQIMTLRCVIGGYPGENQQDCSGDWELQISGPGPLIVE